MHIEWSKHFSVGVDELDSHHKRIIGMMNVLYKSVKQDKDKIVIPKILDGLTYYAHHHFSIEEGWFLSTDYPDKEMHVLQHEEFRKNLSKLKDCIHDKNKIESGLNLMEFMTNWFSNHILKIDTKMVPYLKEDNE